MNWTTITELQCIYIRLRNQLHNLLMNRNSLSLCLHGFGYIVIISRIKFRVNMDNWKDYQGLEVKMGKAP